MKNLATLGRILFALPFGILGLNHFIMYDFYLLQLTSFIPAGGFTVILTGVVLIIASVSIIIKKFIPIICWILAGLLFIFIVTIHIPNLINSGSSNQSMISLIELFKDTSLLGGSIMIAAFYTEKK
jgi:putative oxidoreductase